MQIIPSHSRRRGYNVEMCQGITPPTPDRPSSARGKFHSYATIGIHLNAKANLSRFSLRMCSSDY